MVVLHAKVSFRRTLQSFLIMQGVGDGVGVGHSFAQVRFSSTVVLHDFRVVVSRRQVACVPTLYTVAVKLHGTCLVAFSAHWASTTFLIEQSNLTTQGVGVGFVVAVALTTTTVVAFCTCLAAASTDAPVAPAVAAATVASSSPAATAAPRRMDTIVEGADGKRVEFSQGLLIVRMVLMPCKLRDDGLCSRG